MPHIRPNLKIKKATGERYSYVVAGAILSCSSGDKPNRLKMPFSHGVYIHNKAQMNIKDHIPNENIFPFGKCYSRQNPTVAAATAANNGVLTPMPCTPMTTIPWIMGKNDKLIEGHPALLSKSQLSCLYCGTIKIEDDGQLLEGAYARQVFREIAEEVSARKSAILTADDAIPVECTPKYRAIITPPSPSTTPTKDAWQEAIEGSVAALTGFMDAVSESGTYNMYQGEVPTEYPKSYLAGKLVGDTGVTVLGYLETVGGAALFGGGVAADATGVGTIVGVPANVAGAAAMAHGSTVATQGAANFGRDAKDFYNHIVGGSSGGTGYTGGRTQKELDDLASDPSHGGRIKDQGIKEREIGLDLERQGKLGRIIRDPKSDKGSEFIDETTGQKWDIKSFESYPNGHTSPKKGAFTVNNAMKKIYKEFERGHNVIIDKRNLTLEHVEQLKDAIQKEGISDRIIWYP